MDCLRAGILHTTDEHREDLRRGRGENGAGEVSVSVCRRPRQLRQLRAESQWT